MKELTDCQITTDRTLLAESNKLEIHRRVKRTFCWIKSRSISSARGHKPTISGDDYGRTYRLPGLVIASQLAHNSPTIKDLGVHSLQFLSKLHGCFPLLVLSLLIHVQDLHE